MSEEGLLGQSEVFQRAKEIVGQEVGEEMSRWDFTQMLGELKLAIESSVPEGKKNSYRLFSRHCLRMAGERYRDVRKWTTGDKSMSVEDVILVLRVLKQIRDGTLQKKIVPESSPTGVREKATRHEPLQRKSKGVVRRVIDHTVGSINSLKSLIVEVSVKPENVYDSDRMQIQEAFQKVCDSFGISVTFPDSADMHGVPLTSEDMAEFGLGTKSRRKNR